MAKKKTLPAHTVTSEPIPVLVPGEDLRANLAVNRLKQSLKQCAHYRNNATARGNLTAANYWEVKVETLNAQIAKLERGAS